MRAGTTVLARSLRGAFTVPVQSETSRVDRLRIEILAAARCGDLVAMHDAIVAYHQLLGIEEGEPDPTAQALASSESTARSVRASAVCAPGRKRSGSRRRLPSTSQAAARTNAACRTPA